MSKDLNFKVIDYDLQGKDLVCTLDVGYEDDIECVLHDFVPDEYNVGEKIVGGWETPDYAEFTDEDFTPQDWWDEFGVNTQKEMIRFEFTKRLKG